MPLKERRKPFNWAALDLDNPPPIDPETGRFEGLSATGNSKLKRMLARHQEQKEREAAARRAEEEKQQKAANLREAQQAAEAARELAYEALQAAQQAAAKAETANTEALEALRQACRDGDKAAFTEALETVVSTHQQLAAMARAALQRYQPYVDRYVEANIAVDPIWLARNSMDLNSHMRRISHEFPLGVNGRAAAGLVIAAAGDADRAKVAAWSAEVLGVIIRPPQRFDARRI